MIVVKDKDLTNPPGSPADGDAYLLYAAPDAGTPWEGWQGSVVAWFERGGYWRRYELATGNTVWCLDDKTQWIQEDEAGPPTWAQVGGGGEAIPTVELARVAEIGAYQYLQAGHLHGDYNNPSSGNFTTNYAVATPFVLARAMVLKGLLIRAASTGFSIKLAMYDNDPGKAWPKNLLASGELSGIASQGLHEVAVSVSLDPGLYWIVGRSDDNPLVYGVANIASNTILGYADSNTLDAITWVGRSVPYASFPTDPFGESGIVVGMGGFLPQMVARLEFPS